jgi:ribosomal protein S18 acetylase RimI-like enzyme
MNNADLIRTLEARSMTAWPALQTIVEDGWVQRFAGGYSGRANSVYPLYPGLDDLDTKIDRVEARYQAQGIQPAFKLTEAAQPPALDSALARRGYQRMKAASVQVADLGMRDPLDTVERQPTGEAAFIIETAITADWLAAVGALRGMSEADLKLMAQILRLLVVPCCAVRLVQGGGPVAVGLGVLDDGWIGLFDIATAESQRRRGYGRAICQQIMDSGRAQGAAQAYLQVVPENAPAIRLYESLGYREAYRYWYRLLEPRLTQQAAGQTSL